MKYFIQGYENLNKDRKILQSLCEVTKSDVRTQTSKNALFRMHKNFKNEIFYTRLRKFKQSQKKFSNLYVRLRKFKQRQKRLKKHFIQKRTKILKIKCFM